MGGDTHMHQPPSAAVSSGTESARFSKRWSLLCVCVCVCACYERQGNLEGKEKQKQRDGAGEGSQAEQTKKKRKGKEEARTAIRNKCAARLSYQVDRCIIIG